MKESKLLAFVLLTLLVALTGCGSQEPPPEPVTLSFVVQEYEVDYFMPLAEEFMQAHPEITIEISPIRGNFFQAFTEADVVGVNLFNFLQFHSRGAFLDLSPLIEQGFVVIHHVSVNARRNCPDLIVNRKQINRSGIKI